MKVEEGNKLIAEFMRAKFFTSPYGGEGYTFEDTIVDMSKWKEIKHAQYHSSWDWLMPVVEKIESLGHATLISSHHNRKNLCYETCIFDKDGKLMIEEDFNLPTKIESVYWAIISFIQWSNNQTPQP